MYTVGHRAASKWVLLRPREEVAMVHSRLAPSLLLVALSACGPEMMLVDPDAGSPSAPSDGGTLPLVMDASTASDAGPRSLPDAQPWPDATSSEPDAARVPPAACPEVVEGLNVIHLGETERRFWVSSPASSTTPPAVVFWFHGFSGPRAPDTDALEDSARLDDLGIRPDADPTFPFVRVLLEDTNLQPLSGLDWDIRTDTPNRDLELFDTVLACVIFHRGVARDRVFAAGFSAGATFANLLHSARGETVRAIYTASGLWANEPLNLTLAHRVTFGAPLVAWDWPALEPIARGSAAVLLTHGGSSDNVPGSPNPVPSNLTEAGRAAASMLLAQGRVVIECEHDGGHVLHPEVTGAVVLGFFAAHVGEGPSPWLSVAPSLPPSCSLQLPMP